MRFSTTVVLSLMNTISALATPVEVVERSTDTGQNVGWKTGPAGKIDKAALKDCVANFGSWNNEVYCGGAKWNLGSSFYQSSDDCKAACKDGMNARIDQGLTKVTCDDWEGAAHCWFMYWIGGDGL